MCAGDVRTTESLLALALAFECVQWWWLVFGWEMSITAAGTTRSTVAVVLEYLSARRTTFELKMTRADNPFPARTVLRASSGCLHGRQLRSADKLVQPTTVRLNQPLNSRPQKARLYAPQPVARAALWARGLQRRPGRRNCRVGWSERRGSSSAAFSHSASSSLFTPTREPSASATPHNHNARLQPCPRTLPPPTPPKPKLEPKA